jgi:hypothetical protein
MNASQERAIAKMDAWLVEMRVRRKEATEVCLEVREPASVDIESVAVYEEDPKEEVAVKPVRALKKRHRDWHLAVRRRGQPNKRTRAMVSPARSWPPLAEG